jgi:hypothetical protein
MTCLDRDRQRVIISALFDSGGPIPRSELRRLLLRGRTRHVGLKQRAKYSQRGLGCWRSSPASRLSRWERPSRLFSHRSVC